MTSRFFTRALVVDSDEVWLTVIERAVRRFGVAEVTSARDLQRARQLVSRGVDLLISEVVIANQRCFPLLREVLERSSSVAIVAVSQQAARSDVFRLRDYGVHTYLEKPIDPAVLHRSLVTLSSCGESAPRAADRIGVGMWVMDRLIEETLNDYTARYRLSNAEVEVLRCAVAGKNRADIARDRSVSTNTVKTQIRALLAKSGHATLHDLVIAFQAMVQQSDVRRSAASFSSSSPPLRAVAP